MLTNTIYWENILPAPLFAVAQLRRLDSGRLPVCMALSLPCELVTRFERDTVHFFLSNTKGWTYHGPDFLGRLELVLSVVDSERTLLLQSKQILALDLWTEGDQVTVL